MYRSIRSRLARASVALGVAVIGAAVVPHTAQAGITTMPILDTVVVAEGVGTAAVIEGLTLELFVDTGSGPGTDILATGGASCTQYDPFSGVAYTEQETTCTLPPGDYIYGLDGVPDGWDVEIDCFGLSGPPEALGVPGSAFTLFDGDEVRCDIFVIQPASLGVAVFAPTYDPAFFDGMTVEAYTDPGGTQVLAPADCRSEQGLTYFAAYLLVECDMAPGDYVLGLDGVPDNVVDLFGWCGSAGAEEQLDAGDFSFTVFEGEITECDVELLLDPHLLVDLVVTGGDHLPDAPIEVFGDGGALVASTTDPDPALCTAPEAGLVQNVLIAPPLWELKEECGVLGLPPGDYDLGVELPDYGYVLNGPAECTTFSEFNRPVEVLPDGTGAFTHGAPEFGEGPPMGSLCEIPVRYVEQVVTADVVVVNDDGGTNDGSAILIEVYDNTGTLVDSGVDPEPGTGNASAEFTLPIGPYTFGVSNADGYEVSVAVTVVDVPLTEIIDDASARFTTGESTTAAGVITADDIPTTTVAPTTIAPTTTVDPNSGAAVPTIAATLPATGSTSSSTGYVALLAAMFLGLGGASLLAARRR